MKSRILLILILTISLLYGKKPLSFSEAYQLGLSNAHKIKSSWYQYKATQERIKQQESALYPQISLSATLSRKFNKFRQKSELNTTKNIETEKSLSINFTQVVYDASLRVATEIEEKQSELSFIEHMQIRQNFATEVLENYIEILKSKNRITILKSYKNYYASLLKLAKGKLKFNLINQMELLNIEVNLEKTKIQIKKERELLKSYKKGLSYLLGIESSDIMLYSGKLSRITNKQINNLLATTQNLNPKKSSLEYQKAKKGLELMEKKIEGAQSAHLPKVNFRANYTKYFSNKESSYYKNRKSISLQLNMPIFQGGRVSAAVEEAKLNRLAALEDTAKIGKDLEIGYEEELTNFKFLIKSVKIYKKAFKKAKLYYKLANDGYKNGIKSLIDVYEAKTKLYETKFKYMQNLYDMMLSYVKLLIISNNMDKIVLIDKIIR